ncbi:12521_t:CDS:2 [Entrophospora sp. SA101]|nr:15051_t:CDS:2 [Entrophospora sp. SA101]CAJ0888147.1 12521_t:CDS:2 [Entrophospora sp. SA101]
MPAWMHDLSQYQYECVRLGLVRKIRSIIPIEYQNIQRLALAKLNAVVTNLCNIIPGSTPMSPSKWLFESLESGTINSAQVMGQESNENFNPQAEIIRIPSPTSLDKDTPNKHQMCD